ncbi:MAG: DUF6941 family protein [Chloroflexota bacterium]
MHIDFAFICDYAEVGSKINALGIGFDRLEPPEVPYVHPLFHLVVQLRANVTEAGKKTLKVTLIDADGNELMQPHEGELSVPKPKGGTEARGRMNVVLRNIRFPHYGAYSLHVVVDGHEMYEATLNIVKPSAPA